MNTAARFPEELQKQIGRAAINWNLIEQALIIVITHILGSNIAVHHSYVLFAHTSFAPKLELFTTLATESRFPEKHPLTGYKDLASQLRVASHLRNKVVHSFYANVGGTVLATELKARGKLEIRTTEVDLSRITTEVDQIEAAAASIAKLVTALERLHSSAPQSGQ